MANRRLQMKVVDLGTVFYPDGDIATVYQHGKDINILAFLHFQSQCLSRPSVAGACPLKHKKQA